MNDPIRILLLGHPEVYGGDQQVEIPRREVRALLYYLACQREPVSRSKVIQLLWAETSEENARKSLRVTLARLRKNLQIPILPVSQDDHLMLDRSGFQSDVLDFLAIVDEVARPLAQMPGTVPLPEPVYQAMRRGVNLWRAGRFLLEGRLPSAQGWEIWQREMEGQLFLSREQMLERLADHDLATGNLSLAIAWLEKAVETDEFNDGLHLRIAGFYERSGRFGEGLAYLQKIRERYADGEVHFPQALNQMGDRLRKGMTLPRNHDIHPWPGRRLAPLPFFGRKSELQKLKAAYQRGGVTVLLGEAGSGKTRLVQELYRSLEPSPRMLIALARPLEVDLPFQPLIDMLRSQVTADEWRELPKSWLSGLALLLPELKVIFPGLEEANAAESLTQPVLFEALRQALGLLCRGPRLLLFLDDLQWCDETTLNAVTYLCEHDFFGDHAALVLACRNEDQPPALQHVLNHLSRRMLPVQITLPPLSHEDVAGLARFVLGVDLADPVVERFGQDTGGNALFLLESLRALLEYSPDLRKSFDVGRLPISGSMHALIHQRLEQLSEDAGLALTIAAVIGSEVELDVLEHACNIHPDRLVEALEELERRRLLHPLSAEAGRSEYHFIHDRIREIIHSELSPARRRVYHLRVANALKVKYGEADAAYAAVMAYHYETAGEPGPAFSYWVKAADYARKLYSLVEAETAYHHADALLDQLDLRIPDQVVFHFYNGWIDFAFNTGNADSLNSAAQKMLKVGYLRQNQLLIGRGHLGLAGVADLRDQTMEGLQCLEDARPFLEQSGEPVLWLRFHYRRGGFLILQNRYSEAIRDLELAMDLVVDPDDPAQIEARANVRYRLAQAFLQNGWPAKSLKQGEQVVEEGRAILNHAVGLRGMTTLALAEYFMCRFANSIEHARTALRMVTPMKNPRLTGTIYVSLAKAELSIGHLDSAMEQARLALESVAASPSTRIEAQALRVQGDVMGALDNHAEAEKYYRLGVAAADPNYSLVDCKFRLGWLLVMVGRVEEGAAILDEVVDFCQKNELVLHLLPAQVAKAWAYLAQGKPKVANDLARRVAAQAVERELPVVHGMAFTVLAAVALQAGRLDEAQQKARVVIREARELGNPLLEMRAIGLVLFSMEDHASPEAGDLRTRVGQLITELGENCRGPLLSESYQKFIGNFSKLQIR
jgi:DNA-binding SARP family transcriptional activator/tetratricopeptide (TPR) repeat protein